MPNNSAQRYWFKRKCYGFGWYPATWEAWIILLFYVIILALNALRIDKHALTMTQVMESVFPATIILTVILIVVCYQTGESPIWQWAGKPLKKLPAKKSLVVKKSSMSKNVKKMKSTKKRGR